MNPREYFDRLYADNADPWHYKTRWYEQRKRAISLAMLPKPQYATAIELGCSNGVLSEALASRCERLLAIDGNAQAITLAKQNLKHLPHVQPQQAIIPDDLPSQSFDLIVISEILYYLNPSQVEQVMAWVEQSLNAQGTLLCVHWRYPIDGFALNGDMVHQQLNQYFNKKNQNSPPFYQQTHCQDADFLLDIWQKTAHSLAQIEGLVTV